MPYMCAAGKGEAGAWGFPNCDTPIPTLQSGLAAAAALAPRFAVFLGDCATEHNVHPPPYNNTVEMILTDINTATSEIGKAFPNIPVFPVLGNHDCWPEYDIDVPGSKGCKEWMGKIVGMWKENLHLTPEIVEQALYGGFYTALAEPGLRIAALNTQWCDVLNEFVSFNQTDHGHQMAWLRDVLTSARAHSERVLILGHIPPGVLDLSILSTWTAVTLSAFSEMVDEFRDVIVGHLWGHFHDDSWHIFKNKNQEPVSVAFVLPSFTPRISTALEIVWTPGKYPGFRTFSYDSANRSIIDFVQYYANVTEATSGREPVWKPLYSARAAYHLPDLSPHSFLSLTESFADAHSPLWPLFKLHFFTGRLDSEDRKKAITCSQKEVDWGAHAICMLS